MKRGGCATTVTYGESDKDIIGSGLGVLGQDIEVSILIEDSRVDEFELGDFSAATAIFFDKADIREFPLGILVERLQVGMGRR